MAYQILKNFINIALILGATKPTSNQEAKSISEESVVDKLIEHDNEMQIVGSEEKGSVEKLTLTRYFHFLNDQFTIYESQSNHIESVVNKFKNRTYAGMKHTIFLSWSPVYINRSTSSDSTVISFEQELPRFKYGNFSTSQITLTLRNDNARITISDRTFVRIRTTWEMQQEGKAGVLMNVSSDIRKTQQVLQNTSFYSFDITELMNHSLVREIVGPTFINFTFEVFEMPDNAPIKFLNVSDFFDTNETSIVLFFTDFIPAETNKVNNKSKRRLRRSISRRRRHRLPSARCRRVSFNATVSDLSWYSTVLQPLTFDLGYCSGYCPFPIEDQSYNFTLHTFLMDRIRHQRPFDVPDDFPHSSCIPIAYEDIEVIGVQKGSHSLIGKEIIKEMSVAQCGCR